MAFTRFLFLMFLMALVTKAQQVQLFDVTKYGAIANGRTDNTKAFLRAWNDACKYNGEARILIPSGTFLLGYVRFTGPCNKSMVFFIKGTLKAPNNQFMMSNDQWIVFSYVDRLSLTGSGTLDGQGASTWSCRHNNNCQARPVVSMRFEFVTNSRIGYITSTDSKNAHFEIYGCDNISLSNLKITAPENSPNTDGIKIANSNQVTISRTSIGTGDDCVAILYGSKNINISQVTCGPGHGISVGSLGRYPNEKDVNGLTVKNCTFKGTMNGLRIKTWASSLASIASGFTFENIFMDNVQNPIIIDQQYCPSSNCNKQVASHVQIKDVTYKDIRGTSSSKVAVDLNCSNKFPCKNIVLRDINLVGSQGLIASCSHVNGVSYGHQRPPSCV